MPEEEFVIGEQFAPAVVLGDQLTREERIRLEALNQSVILNATTIISDEQVLQIAKRFERYIKDGEA